MRRSRGEGCLRSWFNLAGRRPKPVSSVMPDGSPTLTLTLHQRIADIAPAEWDACAGTLGGRGNPFVSHAFLSAVEDSGSAGSRTGWLPQHAALREEGRIVAV